MHEDLPSALFQLSHRVPYVRPRFLGVPCLDSLGFHFFCEEGLDVGMLVKNLVENSSMRGVDVFWWLTGMLAGGVGVEICLSPF